MVSAAGSLTFYTETDFTMRSAAADRAHRHDQPWLTPSLLASFVLIPVAIATHRIAEAWRPGRGIMPHLPARPDEWTIQYIPVVLVAALGIFCAVRARPAVRRSAFIAAIAWNGLWLAFYSLAVVALWGEKF